MNLLTSNNRESRVSHLVLMGVVMERNAHFQSELKFAVLIIDKLLKLNTRLPSCRI